MPKMLTGTNSLSGPEISCIFPDHAHLKSHDFLEPAGTERPAGRTFFKHNRRECDGLSYYLRINDTGSKYFGVLFVPEESSENIKNKAKHNRIGTGLYCMSDLCAVFYVWAYCGGIVGRLGRMDYVDPEGS